MRTVLLVDDDPRMHDLIAITLAVLPDLRVRSVATATAALDLLRRERVDLVLLDAGLPDLEGLAGRGLRHHRADHQPRVVLLTGRASSIDAIRARELGADTYITRPFSPLVLVAHVDLLLAAPPRARTLAAAA